MKCRVLAVGGRGPDWVERGFAEYAGRLPRTSALELVHIAAAKQRTNPELARRQEGERILKAAGQRHVVALDEAGQSFGTRKLADWIERWQSEGRQVDFVIGGADGLAESVLSRADLVWSLSPLTFPHALVRLLLAEQLYRAWTVTAGHPYHRGR